MWTRIVVSLVAVALLAGCASDESRAEQLCIQAARALDSTDPQRAGLAFGAVQGLLWRSDRIAGRGFDTELADQMSARCPYELGAVLLVIDQQDATAETTTDVYRPYIDEMRTASPDPTLLNPEPRDDDGPFAGLGGFGWGFAGLAAVLIGLRVFEVAVRAPARRRHAYWEAEADAARDAREEREAAAARGAPEAFEALEEINAEGQDPNAEPAAPDDGTNGTNATNGTDHLDSGSDGLDERPDGTSRQ